MSKNSFKKIVKKIIYRNYIYFIYRYYRSHYYKIRPLYEGINSYLDEENVKFNLRRDIHRIEKGLSFKRRRKIFAIEYIEDVVDSLVVCYEKETIDQDTLEWSISVLEKYFSVVSKSGSIKKAFQKYSKTDFSRYDKGFVPYPESERTFSPVTYKELLDLSLRRRSVRFYKNLSVDPDLVSQAVEIAKLSPSACNRQAFRYLYFDNKLIANRIAEIPGGVRGYSIDNIIVVVGEYAGYFLARDSTAPIIDASLSTMSLLYALETVGLGSVCINWPNESDKEEMIRKVIDLKKSEFVIMLIGIGHPFPEGMVPYSKKRSNDDLLLINQKIK